jgi:hypothetical protein
MCKFRDIERGSVVCFLIIARVWGDRVDKSRQTKKSEKFRFIYPVTPLQGNIRSVRDYQAQSLLIRRPAHTSAHIGSPTWVATAMDL